MVYFVIGTATLEGEHRLRVLAFEVNFVAGSLRKRLGQNEGRLNRSIVHASGKNHSQVVKVMAALSCSANGGEGGAQLQVTNSIGVLDILFYMRSEGCWRAYGASCAGPILVY